MNPASAPSPSIPVLAGVTKKLVSLMRSRDPRYISLCPRLLRFGYLAKLANPKFVSATPARLTALLGQTMVTGNELGSQSLLKHNPVWRPYGKETSSEMETLQWSLGSWGFPGSAAVLCVSPWSPPLMSMTQFNQKLVFRSQSQCQSTATSFDSPDRTAKL